MGLSHVAGGVAGKAGTFWDQLPSPSEKTSFHVTCKEDVLTLWARPAF